MRNFKTHKSFIYAVAEGNTFDISSKFKLKGANITLVRESYPSFIIHLAAVEEQGEAEMVN